MPAMQQLRANKLYALYQQYDSLDQIDDKAQRLLQEKYFKRSFSEVWNEAAAYYQVHVESVIGGF